MPSVVALVSAAPDVDAFEAGFQLGLYAVFVAIGALLVISTVRRVLGV